MPNSLSTNCYVDASLTKKAPAGQTLAAQDFTLAHNLGETNVYDVKGRQKTGFVSHTLPTNPGFPWRPGRDLYKINGMVGQTFFQNAAG